MNKNNNVENKRNLTNEEKLSYGLIFAAITGAVVRKSVKTYNKYKLRKEFKEFDEKNSGLKLKFSQKVREFDKKLQSESEVVQKQGYDIISIFTRRFEDAYNDMDLNECEEMYYRLEKSYEDFFNLKEASDEYENGGTENE